MINKLQFQIIEQIAKKYLKVDTLAIRNSDDLDFYDGIAIWEITETLIKAFEAGVNYNNMKRHIEALRISETEAEQNETI